MNKLLKLIIMKNLVKFLFCLSWLLCSSNDIFAYDLEVNGIYYNLNVSDRTLSVTRKYYYEGYITIPDEIVYNSQTLKVVSIEKEAFKNCANLRSVTIGNNVTSIGPWAFQDSGVQSVVLGKGVKSIGQEAFSRCKKMKSIDLGNVESIGVLSFFFCELLEEIKIPASCKQVGLEAFKYCKALKKVTIEDSPNGLNFETSFYTDENPFSCCENIEYVYLGRNIIRDDNIVQCYIFGHNTIKNIVLGPNVSKVDDFVNCTSIETIRSYIQNPYMIALFSNTTYATAIVTVPIGTLELYRNSSDWGKFFNIIEENISSINTLHNTLEVRGNKDGIIISGASNGEKIEIFNLSGEILYSGIVISSLMNIPLKSNMKKIVIIKIGKQDFKIQL